MYLIHKENITEQNDLYILILLSNYAALTLTSYLVKISFGKDHSQCQINTASFYMLARYIHLVEDGTIVFPSYLMSSNFFWIASSIYSLSVIYSTEKLGVKAQ